MALDHKLIIALVEERDRAFVGRIAQDYNLDYKELYAKFEEVAGSFIKIPRKYKQREEPPAEAKCQGITAKKEPCKFSALPGSCFCKRHAKTGTETPTEKVVAPPKMRDPVHSHEIDGHVHADCELCQTHGNPFGNLIMEFEVM